MTNRNIENTVRSAFSKAVPDVLDTLLEQCEVREGCINMTETRTTRRRRPLLRIAAIIAVLMVALAATVSAVSLTGLIGEQQAFISAYEHLANSLEGQARVDITSFIVGGMISNEGVALEQSNIGLSAGRLAYKLVFTAYDTRYFYTVDAKTGVVIDSKSEPLTAEEMAERYAAPVLPQGIVSEEQVVAAVCADAGVSTEEARYSIWFVGEDALNYNPYFGEVYMLNYYGTADNFGEDILYYVDARSGEIIRKAKNLSANPTESGISEISYCIQEIGDHFGITYLQGMQFNDLYGTTDMTLDGNVEAFYIYKGYVYHAIVNPETLEYITDEIFELDGYEGERELLETKEGYISSNDALKIAEEYFGIDYSEYRCANVGYYEANSYRERDEYSVCFMDKEDPNGRQLYITIDCVTGEVNSANILIQGADKASFIPSSETVDGRISEVDALIAVLDEIGIRQSCIRELDIGLSEDEYNVSFTSGGIPTVCRVDALTGEVLSVEGLTRDMLITEEDAIVAALEAKGLKEDKVSNLETQFNDSDGELVYTVIFDAYNAQHIVFVNAITGEVAD